MDAPPDHALDFINALYGGSSAPALLAVGDDDPAPVVAAAEITAVVAAAGDAEVYAFPIDAGGEVNFLYRAYEHEHAGVAPEEFTPKPTALLLNEASAQAIAVYGLAEPASPEAAAGAAAELGCDRGEPIPLPSARWRVVWLDPDALTTLADLEPAPPSGGVSGDLGFGRLNDMVYARAWDAEADYAKALVRVALVGRLNATRVKVMELPVATLAEALSHHREGAKDGAGHVYAEGFDAGRNKSAATAVWALVWDIDGGQTLAEVLEAVADDPTFTIVHTTHSHGTRRSKFPKDAILMNGRRLGLEDESDVDLIRPYLGGVKGWRADMVASATGEFTSGPDGRHVWVDHAPIDKVRVIKPLAQAIDLTGGPRETSKAALQRYRDTYFTYADRLGLQPDRTGVDPNRIMLLPRHPAGVGGVTYAIICYPGPLLDPSSIAAQPEGETAAGAKRVRPGAEGRASPKMRQWAATHAMGFQIADLIRDRAPERVRSDKGAMIEIECPFDGEHSNPGDPGDRACIAVNAGDGSSQRFVIKCQHDSCRDRSNLEMLEQMMSDGWFE